MFSGALAHGIPALLAAMLAGGGAAAADLTTTKEPPPPPTWWSTITVNGEIEAGIMGNPDSPPSGLNWGHLFTDRANEPLFNQGLLTIQRPIDSSKAQYDVGFVLQVMYGSDARSARFLGECDYCINSLYQVALEQAFIQAHTPWVFPGGIDWKVGSWPGLEGIETIEADTNLFYSHSYLSNYSEPFFETGVLAISHINPTLDIYTGISSGESTTLVPYIGDNNNAPAFDGGIGLNNLGPKGSVTVLATTHIGPEDPYPFYGPPANSKLRYVNDLTVTWKATDKLTLQLDGNYLYDSLLRADAYGAAGYASYQTPWDWLKINGRAEVYRDDQGAFVAAFPGYFDYVNLLHGYTVAPGILPGIVQAPTTYLELTAGLNITPTIPASIPYLKGVIFRPEVRYDTSLNGTTPFDLVQTGPASGFGTKSSQVTIGGDIVLKF
ncbi:MAG TPA: outer membrane beta-barrel protein [Gemmataceae bacterium]|nr:outer membrane beta-barrel protein [Gemmataceae bacterium]